MVTDKPLRSGYFAADGLTGWAVGQGGLLAAQIAGMSTRLPNRRVARR